MHSTLHPPQCFGSLFGSTLQSTPLQQSRPWGHEGQLPPPLELLLELAPELLPEELPEPLDEPLLDEPLPLELDPDPSTDASPPLNVDPPHMTTDPAASRMPTEARPRLPMTTSQWQAWAASARVSSAIS